MAKSPSSKDWLREHAADPYVKMAQKAGYRARSAYKLLELNKRDRVLRPGLSVVDLGAAPGGWTQVAAEVVGAKGQIVAVDILPMDPIPGVTIITGDFTTDAVLQALERALDGRGCDLVLSDMAPNISGIRMTDQARIMNLVEAAREFAIEALNPGGDMLVKLFQGHGFTEFLKDLKGRFGNVVVRKPAASRGRSPELYVLARSYGV